MIRPLSTTTSSSTQVAPAFFRSVWIVGYEVSLRPATTSASINVQGAWQIAAMGLPESKTVRTNCKAHSLRRKLVGIHQAAGEHRRVELVRLGFRQGNVDGELVAPLGEFPTFDLAFFGRNDAPCRRLLPVPRLGSVSSTCSKPLATSMATFLPFNSSAMAISPNIESGVLIKVVQLLRQTSCSTQNFEY